MRKDPIVIVGGGAAGLAAAVFCARRVGGENVLLLEKQPRVGKKLLATGNGTCNLSNIYADVSHYHGGNPAFVQAALSRFSPQDARDFFASIGVVTVVRENGRVYPLCAQASAVLDCLRLTLDSLGVVTRCDTTVLSLQPQKDGVSVKTATETIPASRVLVAVGGAASASLGGSSDGYRLLTDHGHEKTPLFPSIVQIRTDKEAVKAVKGIRVDAALSLQLNGKTIADATGEILFADYGVSGPAAMLIGRVAANWERRKKGEMHLLLDVLPTLSEKETAAYVDARCACEGLTLENLLTGLLQKRLGQTIVKAAAVGPLSKAATALDIDERQRLVKTLKGWSLPVCGSAGMNAAQVTAGGWSTREFDPMTMASKRIRNVYAVGEALDIDGDCGGYNLQWAWSSAYAASMAMTEGYV